MTSILGVISRDCLFELDEAGKEGNLAIAFEIAHRVFSEGKDLVHFVEILTEHFRHILMIKMGAASSLLDLSESDRHRYAASAKLYTQEQCLYILDFLVEAQNQIRFTPSSRIALEALLLRILRSHHRLPIDALVSRLSQLEQALATSPSSAAPSPAPLPTPPKPATSNSMTEDPTPTAADLGRQSKNKTAKPPEPPLPPPISRPQAKVEPASPVKTAPPPSPQQQSRYDTLLQFAAVELEGTLQKKTY